MSILSAAAAFAVLMIIFSTAVASITESYLRISAIRAEILSQSVLSFLKHDPTIRRFLGRLGQDANPSAPGALANALTLNFGYQPYTKRIPLRGKGRVERLSTFSFLQRLANTELGREIAKSGEETALRSLTMGFERYVAASNEVFRKRAQAVSMALSIAFALIVNINAPALFKHLVHNPEFSASLTEQGKEFAAENAEQLKRLENSLAILENDAAPDTDLANALVVVRNSLNDTQAKIGQLSESLPIGWDYYPHGDICLTPESEEKCVFDLAASDKGITGFIKWLAGTLLAGFLIGLGGPFWYRVFTSLSHVFQLLRNFGGEPRKEAIEANAPANQPASQNFVDAVLNDDNTHEGTLMTMFRASTGLDPKEFEPQ